MMERSIADWLKLMLILKKHETISPKRNENRNTSFKELSKLIPRHLMDREYFQDKEYVSAWMVASKILLHELRKKDTNMAIPSSSENQVALVENLPNLYSNVSQEERASILRLYISMPREEVIAASDRYGEELLKIARVEYPVL